MSSSFSFVPIVRTALAAAAAAPSPGSVRRRLAFDAEVRGDGAADDGGRIPLSAEVLSAGDIIGIHPSAIARIEPERGLRGFEPNYMPFVVFQSADFPWRYSLDVSDERVLPWITLLALQPDEFEFVDHASGPLPRIRVFDAQRSLPPLAQSWAFVHSQVHRGDEGAPLAELFESDPDAHFARLLCPRKLEPTAVYYLFVVPVFEAGRRAGLGQATDVTPYDALSWSNADANVELPVYVQSRLTTSTLEDVEQLMRRLKPFRLSDSDSVGRVTEASAAKPGYYADYDEPGQTFDIPAALVRPGEVLQGYNTEPSLARKLSNTLGQVIAGESVGVATDGPDVEDPLVAMPPYGWRYGPFDKVVRARASRSEWFDRTNLDLKYRYAAGLGAECVRADQEELIRRCWAQYQSIIEANRRLHLLRAAQWMADRLASARLAKLPFDVVVSLSESVLPYAQFDACCSVLDELRTRGVPPSFASRALRRIAAKRPIRPADLTTHRAIPTPALPGDLTPNPALLPVIDGADPTIDPTAAPIGGRPIPADRIDERTRMDRWRRRAGRIGDTPDPDGGGHPFGRLDGFHEQLRDVMGSDTLFDERVGGVGIPVDGFRSEDLAGKLVEHARQLPKLKSSVVLGGLTEPERRTITPVYRAPRVAIPLVDTLRDVAEHSLLNGARDLPPNTVSLAEENRLFIEAFCVGANHALNEELRWREFPTDMRGTILPRFWDRGRPPDDTSGDDIAPIAGWTAKLGRNFPPHDSDGEANLVLIIRGDVVRKLGQMVVVLHRATGTTWRKNSGTDHHAVFFGRLGADVAYYGFDVSRASVEAALSNFFFLLLEPVGRLRFGLDVATVATRRARTSHARAPKPFPLKGLKRAHSIAMPVTFDTFEAPPPTPTTWDDFSWSHVALTDAGYVDVAATSVAVTTGPAHWSAEKTSASIARSFWQKPFGVIIPAVRVL